MKRILTLLALFIGFLGLANPSAYSQETITVDLKQKIRKIEVRGNISVPADIILSPVRAKVGDYFDENLIAGDIKSILGLGEIDSLELKKVEVPGGLNLIFIVREMDKIVQAIRIKGNVKTRRDEIRAVLRLGEGEKYNYHLVQEDIASIYALKQYEKVDVKKKDIPGGLELTYVVTEFPVMADMPENKRYGPVKLFTLPSKTGVPYLHSSSMPAFSSNSGRDGMSALGFFSRKPDYYPKETFIGPEQGPLMLNIGAIHNFLGSK